MITEDADFRAVSDEQIQMATGKTWGEWYALLDHWGPDQKLAPTVNYLMEQHGLSRILAQAVAVYFKWEQRAGNR